MTYAPSDFSVSSEIGRLRRVMLHRPGKELERLTIDNKDDLLFDDILWVEEAQKEHDAFADLLRDYGAEVVYFERCLEQILRDSSVRMALLDDVLALEALDIPLCCSLRDALQDVPADKLAALLISGLTKRESQELFQTCQSLVLRVIGDHDFIIRPLPNLYFQRDPFSFVNNGVVISCMNYPARQREPLYAKYIFMHHPYFKGLNVLYGAEPRDVYPYTIEGGDVLVLRQDVVAIGVSERTRAGTVQIVGRRLAQKAGVRRVLAVDIPKTRASMHLDTVFTMVDRDAFTIYPDLRKSVRVAELLFEEDGKLLSIKEHESLDSSLQQVLGLESPRFIETGGGDPVMAARDQWNDGTNTFSIAPGVVVTYRRNVISNQYLRDQGIKVHEIRGAELGRGRGGPRCMSHPLLRDPL